MCTISVVTATGFSLHLCYIYAIRTKPLIIFCQQQGILQNCCQWIAELLGDWFLMMGSLLSGEKKNILFFD